MTLSVNTVKVARAAGYFLDILEYPSQSKIEIHIGSGYLVDEETRDLVVTINNSLIKLSTEAGTLINIRDVTDLHNNDEWSCMQKIVNTFVETLKTELSINNSFVKIENKELENE